MAHQAQSVQQFTEDEVQNLKEIFDLFDKEKNQTINVKDLETIMGSLQRDPAEVREFIDDLGQEISFDQFIDLMQKIENRIVHNQENEQLENQQQLQQAQQP